ncbi:MAG: polyphosphate kinase 2 family protein [bacterium]|nr:polyphosphate kinase 2 family protein [bacterium]
MRHDGFLVTPGRKVRLSRYQPRSSGGLRSKKAAKELLGKRAAQLAELQNMLFAQRQHGVLVIVQAMDAAGKDSATRNVFARVDPHGLSVVSFKRPSEEDLLHDFLRRHTIHLPQRGHMTVFNRSWYEEMLAVRVHSEYLARQNLPREAMRDIWKGRFRDVNAYEAYLARNGIVVIKFFLNVSRDEQRERFLERMTRKDKNYKFAAGDLKERALWKQYMRAYEKMLAATSTPEAPWYVVPADRKWHTRAIMADIIVARLKELRLSYPSLDPAQLRELRAQRKVLERRK